jgi:hypothetical protein
MSVAFEMGFEPAYGLFQHRALFAEGKAHKMLRGVAREEYG